MDALQTLDAGLALLGASLAAESSNLQHWLFLAADSIFLKSLLFAPWLLVAWSRGAADERERVLATPASCALALVTTWIVTSLWLRPRPLHSESGLEEVALAFSDFAAVNPGWLHWGSFPSDHAAYLTALGLGLYTLNRGVGTAALAVGIGVCCLARMFVGLHYTSDVVAGVAVGAAAHLVVSTARSGFAAPAFRQLRSIVEANAWLQLAFAVVVVEMAVMFRDLRAIDRFLFPLP